MSAERVSVSLPEDVRRASQRIADELGLSFSAVVAEAPSIRPNTVPFDENELQALAAEAGVPYLAPGRTEEPAA